MVTMPAVLSMKAMNAVHRALIAITGGRAGWSIRGMPTIELTTTGRRSGEPRTNFLTSPLQVDGGHVIVASRGGDDVNPAWFLNLRDYPDVTVRIEGGRSEPKRARILDGDERDRTWEQVVARYPHYGQYQSKTRRVIPLVILENP